MNKVKGNIKVTKELFSECICNVEKKRLAPIYVRNLVVNLSDCRTGDRVVADGSKGEIGVKALVFTFIFIEKPLSAKMKSNDLSIKPKYKNNRLVVEYNLTKSLSSLSTELKQAKRLLSVRAYIAGGGKSIECIPRRRLSCRTCSANYEIKKSRVEISEFIKELENEYQILGVEDNCIHVERSKIDL